MASYQNYNFGIEIETVVRPYGPVIDRSNNASHNHWFKQLADKLENRNIPAVADNLNPPYNYSKHPEYYSKKWFITRDGSLNHGEASCGKSSRYPTNLASMVEINVAFQWPWKSYPQY
jgi:hypothetical protein